VRRAQVTVRRCSGGKGLNGSGSVGAQAGSFMAKVDEPFAPLRAVAAAPMWFRLASLVIGWLTIAAPCMAMQGEPDPQREVCRRVAMSPEEYRALADEIRRLPPKAVRGEDEESRVAALLRERLEQILAGRGNTDQQIATILGLMRTIEAEVGLPSWEPE
jgi:hypothetical protein